MASRSGPWAQLRAPTTYAANDTWYQVDADTKMGTGSNCVRLYVTAGVASPGNVCFHLQHSPGDGNWYDYCDDNAAPVIWGSVLFYGVGSKSIELDSLNLPPGEQLRIFFLASNGAGSATLEIKSLAFESTVKTPDFSDPEFYTRVGQGLEQKYTYIHKFGENPSIDTATTPEDMWNYTGPYTFSTTSDIDTMSSSSPADLMPIVVIGQADDGLEITQLVFLNGQNKVSIPTPFRRVYRMINLSPITISGMVYCYVDSAITDGVPDDPTTVRALIDDGDNQTQMAIYTVPSNMTGYLVEAYVGLSRVGINSSASLAFSVRRPGGVFRVQNRIALVSAGSTSWWFSPKIPVGPLLPGTDAKITIEDVTSNNTGVSGAFTILLERTT